MRLTLDISRAMDAVLGEGRGLEDADLEGMAGRVAEVHRWLQGLRARPEGEGDPEGEGGPLSLTFLDLPGQDISAIEECASALRHDFDHLVVLGIGGSSLGGQALLAALAPDSTAVHFADNVDPVSFSSLLDRLPLERTAFNVISKSGATVETVSQFLIVRERLRGELGETAYRERIVVTTDPSSGALRRLAADEGLRALPVPPAVGGRYSVLSAVGLLPAAVAGVPVGELLAGAREMAERVSEPDLWHNPAYLFAAVLHLHHTLHGRAIVVMMPYSDRLWPFALWFQQLWAESLGKAHSTAGELVNRGSTPLPARGVTDQHSQLQLFIEGPRDKVVTFVRVEREARDLTIPSPGEVPPFASLNYLGGHTLGELMEAEWQATARALATAGRPSVTFCLPELTPHSFAQLLFCCEVATAFAGGLYDLNPFDQPGVEAGKQLTARILGRPDDEG